MGTEKIHPGLVDGWIPLRELWFRLNMHKRGWDFHVVEMNRVPHDCVVKCTSGKVHDGYRYNGGSYVKWPLAAELLMDHFRDAQIHHAQIRLKALGFDSGLNVKDPNKGIIRMNNMAIDDFKACVKEEKGGTDHIPRSLKRGDIGEVSMNPTGKIKRREMDVVPVQRTVTERTKDAVKKSINEVTEDDGLDIDELLGDIGSIDFNDPDEVASYHRKCKIIKELTAAKKEAVKLAKESNSTLEIAEVEKLLEGTMIAFRTTLDQAVPKVSAEIHGAIVTELVRKDPTLQKRLAKLDMGDLNNKVRGVFDKAAYELSELLGSFSER